MLLFRIAAISTIIGISYGMLEFKITKTWNGGDIDHEPIHVKLEKEEGTDGDVRFTIVSSPFFDNEPPPAEPHKPFMGLWDYEVVEAFFLNDKDEYLEIELGPGGQYINLLLAGQSHAIRHSLPMTVSSEITSNTWSGYCIVPAEHLPFNITRFNAYAIHTNAVGERIYESLYPADPSEPYANFHNLKYFQPINIQEIIPDYPQPQSQFWKDALEGIFRYSITKSWNGQDLQHTNKMEFTLNSNQNTVEVNINSPFYDDEKPPSPEGRYEDLFKYEVVEFFFANNNNEYLQVEFGPHNHYMVYLYRSERETISDTLEILTTATISGDKTMWTGKITIPGEYFPPNVTRMNAFAMYNPIDRQREALYPAPETAEHPDFHKLKYFEAIDFEYQLEENSQYSDIWLAALETQTESGDIATTTENSADSQQTTMQVQEYTIHTSDSRYAILNISPRDDDYVELMINAPFYNDPKPMQRDHMKLRSDIDNYEGIEVTFSNDQKQKLQLFVGPHGDYNSKLIAGDGRTLRSLQRLEVDLVMDDKDWIATIVIPRSYIPENADKISATLYHGVGFQRMEESLMQEDSLFTDRESNRFLPIDLSSMVTNDQASELWRDSLNGIYRYTLNADNSNEIMDAPIEVTLQGFQAGIELNISSPILNENKTSSNSTSSYWCQDSNDYIQFLFKRKDGQSMVVNLDESGKYFVYFSNSIGTLIAKSENGKLTSGNYLDYFISSFEEKSSEMPNGLWKGSVMIPIEYISSEFSEFNIFTKKSALFKSPQRSEQNEVDQELYGEPIDFEYLQPENRKESEYWSEILQNLKPKMNDKGHFNSFCRQLDMMQIFNIESTWNGLKEEKDIASLTLQPYGDDILLSVSAPYHADPPPSGEPGLAFMGLWNYEVVEAFFLNDDSQYLEVEIAPGGQHLVLLLSNRRKPVRHSVPLEVYTNINEDKWEAHAIIPSHYLPPKVTKFNAYAINGVEPRRNYFSLYPTDSKAIAPDFHALEFFKEIDFSQLQPITRSEEMSQFWQDAMNGVLKYRIDMMDLDQNLLDQQSIHMLMKGFQAGVEVNITAPLYKQAKILNEITTNDIEYKEFELIFANNHGAYLSIIIDPQGNQKTSLFRGENNLIKTDLGLDYIVQEDRISETWKGSMLIPPECFPVNVTRMNTFARYESGQDVKEISLYDAKVNSNSIRNIEAGVLANVYPMDFEFLVENNKQISDIWANAIIQSKRRSSLRTDHTFSGQRRRKTTNSFSTNSSFQNRVPQNQIIPKPRVPQPVNPSKSRNPQTVNPSKSRKPQTINPSKPTTEKSTLLKAIDPIEDINQNSINNIGSNDDSSLYPFHSQCSVPGLVPDRSRCQLFYECVIEDGQWAVYKWRCSRGLIYDPVKIACIPGVC